MEGAKNLILVGRNFGKFGQFLSNSPKFLSDKISSLKVILVVLWFEIFCSLILRIFGLGKNYNCSAIYLTIEPKILRFGAKSAKTAKFSSHRNAYMLGFSEKFKTMYSYLSWDVFYLDWHKKIIMFKNHPEASKFLSCLNY